MDIKTFTINGLDGEDQEITVYAPALYDVMLQFYEAVSELLGIKDDFMEETISFLREFVSRLCNFGKQQHKPKGISPFVVLTLYKWSILRLPQASTASSFDGIANLIRRIFLIHHQRTTSVSDDSALCAIA